MDSILKHVGVLIEELRKAAGTMVRRNTYCQYDITSVRTLVWAENISGDAQVRLIWLRYTMLPAEWSEHFGSS
jgi:hypothetical protein